MKTKKGSPGKLMFSYRNWKAHHERDKIDEKDRINKCYNRKSTDNLYVYRYRVNSNIELALTLTQFTGNIKLPSPRSTAVRRYFAVDFSCDVEIAQVSQQHVSHLY